MIVTWPKTPIDGVILLPGEELEFDVELENDLVDAILTTMIVQYEDGTVEEISEVVTYVPGITIVGDLDGNGIINVFDLLELLAQWGECDDCDDCPADLDGGCSVNVFDLLLLLGNWG